MKDFLINLFSFNGKIGRLNYFLIQLFFTSILCIMLAGAAILNSILNEQSTIYLICSGLFLLIFVMYLFFGAWINIAITVKRLRDFEAHIILWILAFTPFISSFIWILLLFIPSKNRNDYKIENKKNDKLWIANICTWVVIFALCSMCSGLQDNSNKFNANSLSFLSTNQKKANSFINDGNTKYALKDYYGSIADYTKAIELDPRNTVAYNNRGNAKSALKDYYGAIADYTKSIELGPDSATYYWRGVAKVNLKDYYGVIADCTKAIELDSNNAETYLLRGFAKANLKDYYGSIADCTKVIELTPNNAKGYGCRGVAKASLNDNHGAITDLNEALRLDPTDQAARELKNSIINAINTTNLLRYYY